MNSLPKTSVLTQSHVPSYSLFAQLLASERLRVTVDRHARTASFAPAERILTLPSWSNFDNDAWLLFIAHEVGHALYTPADSFSHPAFASLSATYGRDVVKGVVNVFEDIRIERLIRAKYRGLAGTFSRGYHSLMNRAFFGFSASALPDLWPTKTVLDRINVYAKVGGLLRLSLTDAQEIAWYNRGLRLETFDDTMLLVAEVIAELTEQQRQHAAQQSRQAQQGQPSANEQGTQMGTAPEGTPTGDASEVSGPSSASGEPSATAQSGASSSPEASESSASESSASESSASPESSTSESSASASPASAQGQASSTGPTNPFAIASQEAAEANLRNSSYAYDRATTLMLPTSTAYLHHNDRTIEQMLDEWLATPDQRVYFRDLALQQRREQSTILASMIAAFRANQAAWQSRRVQVSRSGVIDTAKLAQYKLVDDLFLRRRSLPEAQNHGFVIHVDWSGSMENKMGIVLWQVLHLIWFAESIKVPVSVYGFSNQGTYTDAGRAHATACTRVYQGQHRGRLVELYRSTASASVKQDAYAFLLSLVLRFSGLPAMLRYAPDKVTAILDRANEVITAFPQLPKSIVPLVRAILPTVRGWESAAQHDVFYHEQVALGGTPLYHALVASVDTVRKFRQTQRIEQCVSVWLTDGEDTDGVPVGEDPAAYPAPAGPAQGVRSAHHFSRKETGALIDPRSGRSFAVESGKALPALFSLHRALTGATVICIDITPAPLHSLSRVLSKSALSIVANNVGAPTDPWEARRRRGGVRAKEIKQTRKRVVIKSQDGTFEETGLLMVTGSQYPEIGCDAYLVTHPDWWSTRADSPEQNAHVQSTSRILSESVDDEDENTVLTDEERAEQEQLRPVRLAAALREGAAHIAMRRFTDLLVPYMAAGRSDATV